MKPAEKPAEKPNMAPTQELLASERRKPAAKRQPMFEAYLELCLKTGSPADRDSFRRETPARDAR